MVEYDIESENAMPIPYKINNNYQPFPLPKNEKCFYLSQIKQLSEAISKSGDVQWFRKEYRNWYKREIKVWKSDCFGKFSPVIWAKWMAWLCMPMQLKYYAYTAWSWLRICNRENQKQ